MTRWQPPIPRAEPRTVVLTERQADVLYGICSGHTNNRIGRVLSITEDTVKTHVKGLFRALGARDRTHAAVLAISGAVDIAVRPRNGNEKKQ